MTWKVITDTCVRPRKPHSCVDTQHRAIRSVLTAKFFPRAAPGSGSADTQLATHDEKEVRAFWYEKHAGIMNLKEIE